MYYNYYVNFQLTRCAVFDFTTKSSLHYLYTIIITRYVEVKCFLSSPLILHYIEKYVIFLYTSNEYISGIFKIIVLLYIMYICIMLFAIDIAEASKTMCSLHDTGLLYTETFDFNFTT